MEVITRLNVTFSSKEQGTRSFKENQILQKKFAAERATSFDLTGERKKTKQIFSKIRKIAK